MPNSTINGIPYAAAVAPRNRPFSMTRNPITCVTAFLRAIIVKNPIRTIANAIPCLQYARSRPESLNRSIWFLDQPLAFNLENIRVDGRVFHALTGRAPLLYVPHAFERVHAPADCIVGERRRVTDSGVESNDLAKS